jgi:hypothetical protein
MISWILKYPGFVFDSTGSNGADTELPYYLSVTDYDVQHTQSASSVLGIKFTNTTSTISAYLPGSITTTTYTSLRSSANMITGGYPCIMSMGCKDLNSYRNMWVEGLSFKWGNETFYIGKTYSTSSFVNATVSSGTSSFDLYSAAAFRKGQTITLYKNDNYSSHLVTNITSNTITIDGTVNATYNKGSSVYADCALIYVCKSTLTSSVISGATTIGVSDATGFAAGQWAMIDDGTNWEGIYISTVDQPGVSGTLTITGGGLSVAYSSANSTVYGGFKEVHTQPTDVYARDFYGWRNIAYSFPSNEATSFGTNPIRTIAITCIGSSAPLVAILLPYGVYKDTGAYSSTLYVSYRYMMVARYLS